MSPISPPAVAGLQSQSKPASTPTFTVSLKSPCPYRIASVVMPVLTVDSIQYR